MSITVYKTYEIDCDFEGCTSIFPDDSSGIGNVYDNQWAILEDARKARWTTGVDDLCPRHYEMVEVAE